MSLRSDVKSLDLALRRYDLRPLQTALMPWGLSSLGRIEGRVMPNLDAVIATLEVICGSKSVRTGAVINKFCKFNI